MRLRFPLTYSDARLTRRDPIDRNVRRRKRRSLPARTPLRIRLTARDARPFALSRPRRPHGRRGSNDVGTEFEYGRSDADGVPLARPLGPSGPVLLSFETQEYRVRVSALSESAVRRADGMQNVWLDRG